MIELKGFLTKIPHINLIFDVCISGWRSLKRLSRLKWRKTLLFNIFTAVHGKLKFLFVRDNLPVDHLPV